MYSAKYPYWGATMSRVGIMSSLVLMASVSLAQAMEPRTMTVATYAYPDRDREAAIRPLADYLSRQSGRPVEARVFASPTALVEALAVGQVDVAVPNLHGYLQALRLDDKAITLPAPDVPASQADRYRTVLLGRGDVDSETLLPILAPTLRLALVGKDSASGGFVPIGHLRALGIEPETDFGEVLFAGSHAAALAALTQGRADVAALAADVYEADRPPGIHVLWKSPPVPAGPLVCRSSDDVPCADIAQWLLRAHELDPSVLAALRSGWPEFGDAMNFIEADSTELRSLLPAVRPMPDSILLPPLETSHLVNP
jgi:phosphonate transport system substrate-binding protein